MKAKEIEDCENCPLLGNHCPGGMTSSPGGIPIEPPCCSWSPEDEISEEKMDKEHESYIRELEEEWEFEKKLRVKKEEAKKRRRESMLHVYSETKEINRLKRKYAGLAKLRSLASAFSVTNEIMKIPKNVRVEIGKSKIEQEMDEIILEINRVKKIKNEKLKELRKEREDLTK